MDQTIFESIVKDVLSNLYDFVALETHPQLFSVIKPPAGFNGSPVDYIRQLFIENIEQLKPPQGKLNKNAMEWRPYLILHKRYVEGISLKDLCQELSIGDRQMRRDHHRALAALTGRLWAQLNPGQPAIEIENDPSLDEPLPEFEIHKENLPLNETLQSVFAVVQRRAQEFGIRADFYLDPTQPIITSDRVILRQILINLFNEAIRLQTDKIISVKSYGRERRAVVEIIFMSHEEQTNSSIEAVNYWSEPIEARFGVSSIPMAGKKQVIYCLSLPQPIQNTILVVDDQPPVINLFRRLLSQTNYIVNGAIQAEDVLPLARQSQPNLILLDVMMPQVDGWEILQMLKLNEDTQHIPVVICSAWAEPDLARSLGAAAFLKKPVTQKALFDIMQQLGLPGF
jgi:CheY-like chemotaxis protein